MTGGSSEGMYFAPSIKSRFEGICRLGLLVDTLPPQLLLGRVNKAIIINNI